MGKGFLDYLKDEQGKKWNKIVKKPQEKTNEKLELGNAKEFGVHGIGIDSVGKLISRKESLKIATNILEKAENERNVSLKEVQKNSLNPLEHAMLIYEGLKDQPRKGTIVISDDINDPLAHAAMLI